LHSIPQTAIRSHSDLFWKGNICGGICANRMSLPFAILVIKESKHSNWP